MEHLGMTIVEEPEPEPEPPDLTEMRMLRNEHARIVPEAKRLELIIRYEAHLHRQYIQTLHELEALQARRNGKDTPLARVDIVSVAG
jgi:hypothetical protein